MLPSAFGYSPCNISTSGISTTTTTTTKEEEVLLVLVFSAWWPTVLLFQMADVYQRTHTGEERRGDK